MHALSTVPDDGASGRWAGADVCPFEMPLVSDEIESATRPLRQRRLR